MFAVVLTVVLHCVVVRVGYMSCWSWTPTDASAYFDLFGIRTAAVRLFYPDYYFPSADSVLPNHPRVEMIADLLPMLLWLCGFIVLYLLLFRGARRTI